MLLLKSKAWKNYIKASSGRQLSRSGGTVHRLHIVNIFSLYISNWPEWLCREEFFSKSNHIFTPRYCCGLKQLKVLLEDFWGFFVIFHVVLLFVTSMSLPLFQNLDVFKILHTRAKKMVKRFSGLDHKDKCLPCLSAFLYRPLSCFPCHVLFPNFWSLCFLSSSSSYSL